MNEEEYAEDDRKIAARKARAEEAAREFIVYCLKWEGTTILCSTLVGPLSNWLIRFAEQESKLKGDARLTSLRQ